MSKLALVNDEHKSFQLRSKRKDKKYAELVLYDQIGKNLWGEGIDAKDVVQALKEYGQIDNLDVRINSPGGDVFNGVTIYNRLKQLDANITVYVDGLAASIASVIMMAGDEIVLSEGSLVMIHSPMTLTYGNQSDHEASIEILDTIEEEMIGIYAKKTKMSRSELRQMVKKETWMNSEEAMEMGFGTTVDSEMQMAACSKQLVENFNKVFRNMPKEKICTDAQKAKMKVNSILKDIEEFNSRTKA